MEDKGNGDSEGAAPAVAPAVAPAGAPRTSDPANSTKRRRLITREQYLSDEANPLMGMTLLVSIVRLP